MRQFHIMNRHSKVLITPNQLTFNKIKFAPNLLNFENQPEYTLEVITPSLIETGFYLSTVDEFYHKYTLDMSSYSSGDVVFIKIYVQDNVNDITEIPSNGSVFFFFYCCGSWYFFNDITWCDSPSSRRKSNCCNSWRIII